MPLIGTIAITGSKQGNITQGANTVESLGANFLTKIGSASITADVSLITAMSVQVTVPTSPQTGQASGAPVQMPSTFTKFADKSSPLLWGAITSSETLSITINMYQNDNKGNTSNYYTIAFTGVVLVSGNLYKPDILLQANSAYVDMETFGFTYAKATWTDNNASTSATFTAAGASS